MLATEGFGKQSLRGLILIWQVGQKKITGLPTITVGSVGLESDFIGFYQGEDEVKSAPIDDLVKRMDDKEFDMVAVGRALLSDPDWVNKVKEGRYDEVIPFSKKHAENYY